MATVAHPPPLSVVLSGDGVVIPMNIVELVANLASGPVVVEEEQEEEKQEGQEEALAQHLGDVQCLAVFLTGR